MIRKYTDKDYTISSIIAIMMTVISQSAVSYNMEKTLHDLRKEFTND